MLPQIDAVSTTTSASFKGNAVQSSFGAGFERFQTEWLQVKKQSEGLTRDLSSEIKPFFQTQILASRLALQTQVLCKMAEGASGVLRRLEQLGSR